MLSVARSNWSQTAKAAGLYRELLRRDDLTDEEEAVLANNLAFSLAYNVVGAGLALAGLITPLAAAVLMPLRSLTVLVSSYKVHTFSRGRGA